MTRAELLDRVKAEQQYWFRKQQRGGWTATDNAARRKFSVIMHAAINPSDVLARRYRAERSSR